MTASQDDVENPGSGAPGAHNETSAHSPSPEATAGDRERGAKAARVRTLTDPLGARGFRATGKRIRTETSARRKVFLASVATFATSFGVVVATNHLPTTAESDGQPVSTVVASSAGAAGTRSSEVETAGLGALTLWGATPTQSAVSDPDGETSAALAVDDHRDRDDDDDEYEDDEDDDDHDDGDHHGDHEDDEHEDDDDDDAWLTASANDTGASQVTSSARTSQPAMSQQPAHTRSGGS